MLAKRVGKQEEGEVLFEVQRVKDCGILNSLWVTMRKDGTYRADYCAGQDYDSEMRTIRRLLTEQY